MDRTLSLNVYEFLARFKVNKGEIFTHTSREPKGAYYIVDSHVNKNYSNFIRLYCNAIKNGEVLTITERPTTLGPLRVDFDLRNNVTDEDLLDLEELQHKYNEEMVENVIALYQREISKITDE